LKFIDETQIIVHSGKGGKGCVSFRREKFVPRGGPNGGDGGKGGNVIIRSVSNKRTLYHLHFNQQFKAENGKHGQGNQRTGKSGKDCIIEVPVGTIISDLETEEILKDFNHPNDEFIVAKGGRGGLGNKHFVTSTRQTPRFAQPGEPGISLTLKIELKLIADIGIIGLPNAGKSTLISRISAAKPKIADYPFTTLNPMLGVVKPNNYDPFIVADIPGLIEGAHEGSGLGIKFLKHIERNHLLLHLIDVSSIDPDNPLHAYQIVKNELQSYDDEIAKKTQIVVLNKMDLTDAHTLADIFEKNCKLPQIFRISAVTGEGIHQLIQTMAKLVYESEST